MRLPSRHVVALAGLLVLGSNAAIAQETYLPATGNEVVIYTHRFKAESFEAGLKLVKEGFTAAQVQMGQIRQNYFLVSPATYDVVVVSFFAENQSVDEWHKFMGRLDILEKLQPLRREPLELKRFSVDAITTSP